MRCDLRTCRPSFSCGLTILAKTIDQKLRGRVIAAHGRNYAVRTDADLYLSCFTRGKKSEVACGDLVEIDQIANDQGVITSIVDRNNLLYRSDAYRKKVWAANLSLMMIVVATEPSFSEDLLGRALVAAEALELPAAIVLNKVDLTTSLELARTRLSLYKNLGYAVHEISVHAAPEQALETLLPPMQDGTTLLLGQSGMGKSSLLNLLIPDALAATREISEVLHSGKHTTTDSRLYDLRVQDGQSIGSVIDTPGFQEFGLAHLTPGEIERAFPEFKTRLGHCRFYNCLHLGEPDCAIRIGVEDGSIEKRRYDLFVSLTRESSSAVIP